MTTRHSKYEDDDSSSPRFWQSRYERDEDHWDHGFPAPPLIEHLESSRPTGDILVPGCGTGHDVRALAAAGAHVIGLDFAPAAVARARAHELVADESYVQGDFFALPDELIGRFDWIFEHTCFCAIPRERRRDYVDSCLEALKPSGKFLGIFYLNPRDDSGDGPPYGVTREEIAELFLNDFEEVSSRVPSQSYEGREGREWVWVGRRKSTD